MYLIMPDANQKGPGLYVRGATFRLPLALRPPNRLSWESNKVMRAATEVAFGTKLGKKN